MTCTAQNIIIAMACCLLCWWVPRKGSDTACVAIFASHKSRCSPMDSYYIYCPPPFRRKAEGHSFRLSVLPFVRPSVRPSFRPPKVLCTLCAQLSFMPIHLKLYRCFCHGLKICMWFGYYPEIIFVTFSTV